ncbi:MAG: peptide-methionine (R)-S-oxide reductase MsrB [Cytophagales bacterium]
MKKFPLFIYLVFLIACKNMNYSQNNSINEHSESTHKYYSRTDTTKLKVSDAEWEALLPKDIFYIARKKGTEYAFSGKYWNYEGIGTYYCAVCGNALFKSDAKFASSCGWPSFFKPIRKESLTYEKDYSYGMSRIEVMCGRCDSHLGHVFEDGPKPTGLRYCINSLVIDFEPDK